MNARTDHLRWAGLALALCLGAAGLVRAEDTGWTPLFDGKTLAGWHTLPGGEWTVVDGAIRGVSPASEKNHGMLVSDGVYTNFQLQCEFKVVKGNSGFYFRSQKVDHAVGLKGFQVEVDGTPRSGGLYETLGRQWVAKTNPAVTGDMALMGEWVRVDLTAQGGDITVKLNGKETARLTNDPGSPSGHFGLQLHGGQDMEVWYRGLKIRQL